MTIRKIANLKYNLAERHIILMKEALARYYRDKLIQTLNGFESPTVNVLDEQMTGTTFGPKRPNQSLYGATVVVQITFKSGDDWQQ